MSRDTVPFMFCRRQKARDENGNGFVVRRTTSLGALGQALHGRCRFKEIVSRVFCDLMTVVKVHSARIRCLLMYHYLFLVSCRFTCNDPCTVGSRRMCLDPLAGFCLYAILDVFHHVLCAFYSLVYL
jgi:hypothetical protein